MRYILSICLAISLEIAVPWPAQAELFDLAPPGKAPMGGGFGDSINSVDFAVALIVSEPVTLSSVGMLFRIPGITPFPTRVSIWEPVLNPNPFGPPFMNALEYTSPAITHPNTGTLSWYDIPVDWTLDRGVHYVAMHFLVGFPFAPEFFQFSQPEGPYQAGPFTVLYGTLYAPFGGPPLFDPLPTIQHFRIEATTTAVPEPSSLILFAVAGALMVLYRLRIRFM